MDKKLYYKLRLTIIALVFIVMSCGKWNAMQDQFIKDGELTYTAKADSVKARGGINRIELSWLFLSDPKISRYKVYWNNRRDSIVNAFTRSSGVDSVKVMITDLVEGIHHFEIFTYDNEGNSSVKAEVIARAYGALYQKTLLARAFRGTSRFKNDMTVEWSLADEDLLRVEVKYKDRSGQDRIVNAAKAVETSLLKDFPYGGTFETRSVFLPNQNGLDTFYTSFAETKFKSDTLVQWNDWRTVFGHFTSLIIIGNGRVTPSIFRTIFDASSGSYLAAASIGGSWNGLDNVCTRGTYVIAQLTGSGGTPRRYNYAHSTGTFPGPNPNLTGGGGWADTDKFFIYQNDIVVRNKTSGKLIRHYLNAAATAVTKSVDIQATESWSKYDKLLASGSWMFGTTPDGKLWRIPVSADSNVAGTPEQIGEGWDQYYSISLNGNNILARKTKDKGELWEYPVDVNGEVGEPEAIWVVKETPL